MGSQESILPHIPTSSGTRQQRSESPDWGTIESDPGIYFQLYFN